MKKSLVLVFCFLSLLSSFSFAQSPIDKDRAADELESASEQAAKHVLTEEEAEDLKNEIEEKKKANSWTNWPIWGQIGNGVKNTGTAIGSGLKTGVGAVWNFFASLVPGSGSGGGGNAPQKPQPSKKQAQQQANSSSRFGVLLSISQFVTNHPAIFDFLMACLKGGLIVFGFYWLIQFINLLPGKNKYLETGIAILAGLIAGWFLMGIKAFLLVFLPIWVNFISPQIRSEKTRGWLTFLVFFLTVLVFGYF